MVVTLLTLALISVAAGPVTFTYHDANAKQVFISGDFNSWASTTAMARSGDDWTYEFDLPTDARIEYKLIVDGQWVLDPADPVKIGNGMGGENSVWQGPKYRFSARDEEPKNPLVRSELSVEGRTIVVFSPQGSAGLPILVYGDGPTYETPGKVQNFVANLVALGQIRPEVIVLVPPIDRMKEYGSDWKPYGDYIFNEVLPAVRKATGASERPEDVFMGGSSMGGLISLRLAEEYPTQLAGGIQCQSAAVQWSPGEIDFSDVMKPDKLKQMASTTRIWLDWGTLEDGLTPANVKLTQVLDSIHRPYGSRVTHEGHNWTAWRNRMQSGLTYILGTSRHP